jgi:tetratricopeptide (TPR) repeat protein
MRSFVALVLSFSFLIVHSQDIELPRKSPQAGVSFTIGMTKIQIDYSSPSVNNRKIWGELVPYGQVWRAGANEATTIEFDTPVIVEGKSLEKGKYAFFLIPGLGEKKWTAIFSKNPDQWGTYAYSESEDALRVDIEPKFTEINQERLIYSIHAQGIDRGYIKFAWEKARFYLRIRVDVVNQAMQNIEKAIDETPEDKQWIVYASGAEFLLDADTRIDQAYTWVKASTVMKDHPWNWYILARILARKDRLDDAISSVEKAIEIGESGTEDNYYRNAKKELQAQHKAWKLSQ